MKHPLGVTFTVPPGHEAAGVYEDPDGVEVFESDDPYLLEDGVSLQPPVGTNQSIQIISSTATGFTVRVISRAVMSVLSLEVLAGAATGVSGASVVVTVVEA